MAHNGDSSHSHRWVRILFWCLGIVLVLAIAAALAVKPLARHMIRTKLQALVNDQLNARLEIGQISFSFPYGVELDNASLVTDEGPGDAVELATFKRLYLQLAEFPIGSGPIVIQRIDIDEPTVHVIETQQGIVGTGLGETQGVVRKRTHERSDRLDRSFKLRHLKITRATLRYEDRTLPDTEPMEITRLGLNLDTAPQSGGDSTHSYHFSAWTGELAKLASHGTFDLRTLKLSVQELTADTRVDRQDQTSILPPVVQRQLNRFELAGQSHLELQGTVPFNDIDQTDLTVDFRLTKGQGVVPGLQRRLDDLTLRGRFAYDAGAMRLNIDQLQGTGQRLSVDLQPFAFKFGDRPQGEPRWSCSPITATVQDQSAVESDKPLQQPFSLELHAVPKPVGDQGVAVTLDGTHLLLPASGVHLTLGGQVTYRGGPDASLAMLTVGGIGRGQLSGKYNTADRTGSYRLELTDLNLAKLLHVLHPKSGPGDRRGLLSGQADGIFGRPVVPSLRGKGEARVRDGHLAELPLLGPVSQGLNLGLFVVTRGHAMFGVDDKVVTLRRAILASATTQIRGHGRVQFDGALDLHAFARPGTAVSQGFKEADIPVVSDVGAAAAKGAQQLGAALTRQFSTVHVTGTLSDPKIQPQPMPAITDDLADLLTSEE